MATFLCMLKRPACVDISVVYIYLDKIYLDDIAETWDDIYVMTRS